MTTVSNEMTLEEVLERFGDVELRFESYYKYSFTFSGDTHDGFEIVMTLGGYPDDIYRFEVTRDGVETLNDRRNYDWAMTVGVVVYDVLGEKVYSWYNPEY